MSIDPSKYRHPPTGPWDCAPSDDSDYTGGARCLATLKTTGGRCRRWARKGSTYCGRHGGCAPTAGSKVDPIRGKYSGVLSKGTLAEAYRKHLQDPNFKDLRDELALARAFAESAALKLNGIDIDNVSPELASAMMAMVAEVRDLVEAIARVDQKINVTLTVSDVGGVVNQIFSIVTQFVHDPVTLRKIGEGLKSMDILTQHGAGSTETTPGQ